MKHTGKRSFPRERALSLIDELADTGTLAVSFTGAGDPLMYPHMAAVLKRVIERGMAFGVTSNFAMPLSDALCALLSKARWLRVSMNAAAEACYLYVHNPKGKSTEGVFARMKDNVARIVAAAKASASSGFAFNGSYVVCEANWREVGEACHLAKAMGLDSLSFRPDIPLQERQESQSRYRTEAMELIDDAREKIEDATYRISANEIMHENNVVVNDPELVCFYMNHTTHIDSSGDVYPCCFTRFDPKYIIGNIMQQPFQDFWHDTSRHQLYKKFRQDFCPPCTYGRYNLRLKPLYGGIKTADELFVKNSACNPFI